MASQCQVASNQAVQFGTPAEDVSQSARNYELRKLFVRSGNRGELMPESGRQAQFGTDGHAARGSAQATGKAEERTASACRGHGGALAATAVQDGSRAAS